MTKWLDMTRFVQENLTALLILGGVMLLALLALFASELLGVGDAGSTQAASQLRPTH